MLEKAWAKVKGNYLIANGDLVKNGIRSLTGIPVFSYYCGYISNSTLLAETFSRIKAADDADYLILASTAGDGSDQVTNHCGVAKSHAYTIISAFEMVDDSGTTHQMVLMRNPWSSTGYSWDWHKDDSRWTDALIAQVPYGFNPRDTNNEDSGLFVAPMTAFLNMECFDYYEIGHERTDEGYVDTWYDEIDDDETWKYYYFTPDTNGSDIYFTVESYSYAIIPSVCTFGRMSNGQLVNHPVNYFAVFIGDTRLDYKYYLDYGHMPILISNYTAGDEFKISV